MKDLTSKDFQAFIQSETKVLVDFWAPWCGPCKMQGKALHDEAEKDPEFSAKIGKVNVDEEAQLAIDMRIDSIPALFIFQQGKILQKYIGLQDVSILKEALK